MEKYRLPRRDSSRLYTIMKPQRLANSPYPMDKSSQFMRKKMTGCSSNSKLQALLASFSADTCPPTTSKTSVTSLLILRGLTICGD